CQQGYNIPYSF
nr:immunoglobulin light chain junction region [Macaca mulatta]MOV74475.1 immunoglobulin light chain junction region [Macaca mulatta]MOV75215.1 immunoglobulin light chain junction region [Macaca mulatta]MOV76195.1 immunoglobulin light chain junction region [Macaca mulatta]MOV76895.1 immunoglobulin light chain junction region [Macaca mulatta]